ncbi:hypothetical protein [Streptomyces sp. 3N207]|uniref:hypothetical protein n=1 Tax=Streptomyces sp. 3N207 TaxID=3457417 RepID=UPI003FD3EC1B
MTTVRAFIAAVAGSGAAAAGFATVGRSLEDGRLGQLSLGLGLCALATAAAGAVVWLLWRALADTPGARRSSDAAAFRLDVVVSVLALPAETGLSWLTVAFATDGHTGAAWLSGGVALAVTPVWLYRLCGDLVRGTGPVGYPIVAALTVSAGSAGWLAVRFAVDGRWVDAVLLACALPMIPLGALGLRTVDDTDLAPDSNRGALAVTLLSLAPAIGLGGVTARLIMDGRVGPAVLSGAPALLLLLAALRWAGAWADARIASRTKLWSRSYGPQAHPGDVGEIRQVVREALEELYYPGHYAGVRPPVPYGYQEGLARLTERELRQLAQQVADRITSSVADRVTDRIAHQVAEAASDRIGTGLERRMSAGLSTLREELQRSVRTSVEEVVSGPPLANFTGFLSLHLLTDDRDSAGHGDGAVLAYAGSRLRLLLAVTQDDRARDVPAAQETAPDEEFFIFEPVHVQGGRDADTVEFEAVVDSTTLTPLPHRRTLPVGRGEKQNRVFAFQLPGQEGQHEVWFQLYQAGRLVQAVALTVHARPRTTEQPAKTGEAEVSE